MLKLIRAFSRQEFWNRARDLLKLSLLRRTLASAQQRSVYLLRSQFKDQQPGA